MNHYLLMLIVSIICGVMFVSTINTADQEPDEDYHIHPESIISLKEKALAIISIVLITMATTVSIDFSQLLGGIIFGLLSLLISLLAQKMKERLLVLALAYLAANFAIGMATSYAVYLDNHSNYADPSWIPTIVIIVINALLFARINVALKFREMKALRDRPSEYDEDETSDDEFDEDYEDEDEYEDEDQEDCDRDYTRYYPYRPARR